MAPLTLEAAYRALKAGELVPVYYITGNDDILKDELVGDLVAAGVDPSARDFNVDIRGAGDLDGQSLNNLVETPPMLAARRAVVVNGLEQWRANSAIWKVLARYLKNPSPTTMLILTHGVGERANAEIAGAARHIHVDGLTPEQARRWALKRAARLGVTLDAEAAGHLVQAVGAQLAHVAMEIDKLAAAYPPERAVTVDDVARLVGIRSGETQGDWVAAALARDTALAVRLLDVVLAQSGVNGVRLVMALGTGLVGTRFARALLDAGASPGSAEAAIFRHLRESRPAGLGNWKDETSRWVRAAARWTAGELDAALRALHQADRALKSAAVSDEIGILASVLIALAPREAAA
jgi:DNA polymerase-3 subunit delta